MRSWRPWLLAALLAATTACDNPGKDKAGGPPQPAAVAPPPAARATALIDLVSLAWTPANADQNLQAFDLQVTGVDVLAVCHVPAGWTINVTGAGAGVTELEGHATVGAAFLGIDNLADIAGLFLVRARPNEKLTVSGELTTGVYGGDDGQLKVQATAATLRREAASQCPPPKL